MPVIARPIVNLSLPREHIRICQIDANETYLLAGRGTFKTTRGIALFVIRRVQEMPRSSGMIVGLSFEDMGNNTINPFLSGLVEMGFKEGKHWVIGKKPPAHWEKPYLGVRNEKYDRVMSWWNGTVMHLVSLEKKAPANGISAQWGIFDEVKFMDERKLIDSVFPAFRGNERHFENCAGYLSKFFATDKEADPVKIQWLLDKRKLVDPVRNAIVEAYQMQHNKLSAEYDHEDTTRVRKREIEKELQECDAVIQKERKDLVYVAEINADDVRPLLGDRWYNDKKRNSSPRLWRVVYLNEDPEIAGETFYPTFTKLQNTYSHFDDIDPSKPFIISPDYQHSIAPIPIAQIGKLPGAIEPSLNYVDEVYTKPDPNPEEIEANGNGSKGSLAEAIQLFCDRYKHHHFKQVYFVYDHNAKGRRVGIDEYYKIVKSKLRANGWRVVMIYTGKAPDHYLKYSRTTEWLKHADPTLPAVMINRDRCPKMITSITNSGAKTSSGKTEKNKMYEDTIRYPTLDQATTTHFSDTFDMVNHAVLFLKMIKAIAGRKSVSTR